MSDVPAARPARLPRVLVLEHLPPGPPDAYELTLARLGVERVHVRPPAGEPLPDWRAFDGVLALGGPMHARDDEAHPWLAAERRLIGEAVRAGTPYWGVCLGAQLLAAALGAPVRRGEEPEVGVLPVTVDREAARRDPVFADAPARFHTLEWHADTFELPDGATLLAGSARYPHQAFVWRRAYGVQFHLEPTVALARHWAHKPGYAPLATALSPDRLEALLAELERHAAAATALAARLLTRWTGLLRTGG
ncbi:MAG: type 1 glutamine amidotransferase [Actinobacteria bacterium]|nr:type 1 glutamine amidotransferase [Actinomycetota bacterium]